MGRLGTQSPAISVELDGSYGWRIVGGWVPRTSEGRPGTAQPLAIRYTAGAW